MKQLFIFFLLYLPSFRGAGGGLLFAQLPVANGPGSGLIYFKHNGLNQTQIYNYDPNQPVSATNPSVNSISLPSPGTWGIAVSNNLNAANPSPTFYTRNANPSNCYYYNNGSNWVNTADSACNSYNFGAGGSFIYGWSGGGGVYKYNGTGNCNLVTNLPSSIGYNNDVAADCAGNFYILSFGSAGSLLRKYDSSGNYIDSFTLIGSIGQIGNGLVIMGNKIFFGGGNNIGLYSGVLIGHTIYCSLIPSTTTVPFSNITDMSSYAGSAFNTIIASADTVYYCSGGPGVHVYGTGPGPYTWSVLSGPATIAGSGDTVSLSSTANATILLSSSFISPCGSSTDTVTLFVKPSPSLPNIISNSPLCSGDSLSLSISNSQAGVSYSWSGPLGFSDTVQHSGRAHMQLNDSGYYYISALSSNGCSIIDSANITVKPIPLLPLAGSNSPLCQYDSLKLTISNPQPGVSYNWYGPNAFSSGVQNPIRLYADLNDSGKYKVKATLNGCSSGYDTTTVIIMPVLIPMVSISSQPPLIPAGQIVTFTANVSNCINPVYQWYRNGSPIPGGTGNPYANVLSAGDHISVTIHCAGCANPDSAVSNQLTTTGVVSWQSAIGNVKVWPNPITDELNIEIAGQVSKSGMRVNIHDIVGRVVYSAVMNEDKIIVNTCNFSRGTYILELISNNGERIINKMVK